MRRQASAQRSGAMGIPRGKYVLGEADFTGCDLVLTPDQGIRYHLKGWDGSGAKQGHKIIMQASSSIYDMPATECRRRTLWYCTQEPIQNFDFTKIF